MQSVSGRKRKLKIKFPKKLLLSQKEKEEGKRPGEEINSLSKMLDFELRAGQQWQISKHFSGVIWIF